MSDSGSKPPGTVLGLTKQLADLVVEVNNLGHHFNALSQQVTGVQGAVWSLTERVNHLIDRIERGEISAAREPWWKRLLGAGRSVA